MKKVAIIGGGVIGLSLAYYLTKNGDSVTIIEKSNEVGGLASGFKIEGQSLEKFYHHLFRSDKDIQELFNELGIGTKLKWIRSEMGFFDGGNLYDFSTSFDLVKFPPVPFLDRIRAGLVSLYLQKSRNYKKFENITAIDWCNKYFGKRFTNIVWKQLLQAKFGEKYYDKVSMTWLWARIRDRSSSRKNVISGEYLGYPEGSFSVFIDALQKYLVSHGVTIYTESSLVKALYKKNRKMPHFISWTDQSGKLLKDSFNVVVVTTSPNIFKKFFNIGKKYLQKLDQIKYLGAFCMVLKLKKSFSKYYWLNITDKDFPFLAVVEHTNFVSKDLFNGFTVLYICKYLDLSDPLFNKSEIEIFSLIIQNLQKINKNFDKSWIVDRYYFKTEFAQHVVSLGHKPISYETGIDGLYYANFSQIYPHDRGMNYAVAQAKELFKIINK